MSEAAKAMPPGKYIRLVVFGVKTQSEWAELLHCTQSTVSRYDNGKRLSGNSKDRVLELARERGVEFNPEWFWRVPEIVEEQVDRAA